MALLSNWINADLFSQLRDKVNAIVSAVNPIGGGTANQILMKNSSTDFDSGWVSRIVSSSTSAITFSTGWAGTGTIKASIDALGTVEISGDLTISTGGTTTVGNIAAPYRPVAAKRFTIADYNGTDGASVLMVCNVATSGDITIFKQSDGTKPANRNTTTLTIRYSAII